MCNYSYRTFCFCSDMALTSNEWAADACRWCDAGFFIICRQKFQRHFAHIASNHLVFSLVSSWCRRRLHWCWADLLQRLLQHQTQHRSHSIDSNSPRQTPPPPGSHYYHTRRQSYRLTHWRSFSVRLMLIRQQHTKPCVGDIMTLWCYSKQNLKVT